MGVLNRSPALIDELTVLQREGKTADIEKNLTPWSNAAYKTLPDPRAASCLAASKPEEFMHIGFHLGPVAFLESFKSTPKTHFSKKHLCSPEVLFL